MTLRVRRSAIEAKRRKAEVREAVETVEDRVVMLARGLADGSVEESDVVAAIEHRDKLRRRASRR